MRLACDSLRPAAKPPTRDEGPHNCKASPAQAGIALVLRTGRRFLSSEQSWTEDDRVYSAKRTLKALSEPARAGSTRSISGSRHNRTQSRITIHAGPSLMPSSHGITFVPQILREFQLHLQGGFV